MSDQRSVLNVGGIYFQTYRSTLMGAAFFRSWFERWQPKDSAHGKKKKPKPLFIDRDGELFRHVLALLRNPDYPFSADHRGELDFYGVPYDEKKLWRPPYCKDCKSVNCDKCNEPICEGCRYTCLFCSKSFCHDCRKVVECDNHLCNNNCCSSCAKLCANPENRCHALRVMEDHKMPFCPKCIHNAVGDNDPEYNYCVYCCMEYGCKICNEKQKEALYDMHS